MKKWLFVVAPLCMLGLFLVFYASSRKEAEAREAEHARVLSDKKAAEDAKRAADEAKARADADARDKERHETEAKEQQDKLDKYNAEMKKIADQTQGSDARAEKYAAKVSELTIELDNLHKQKDELTRQGFDLEKKVQLAEVAREDADMDVEREVSEISTRADQSTMGKMPIAPPPPKPS